VTYLGQTGMVCSVGLGVAAASAAMRAGMAKFDELPYADRRGRPIVGASVPGLGFRLRRGERLVEMMALAIADCLGEKPAFPLREVPLLVGLPNPDGLPGGAPLAGSIVLQVQARVGLQFHPTLSRGIPKGHTAGFEALRVARELLMTTDVLGCLVCGVDSHINASSLLWLEQQWRLKHEDHSDGVIPGRRQPRFT
jgi:3-oxoacyl-[acyl-carrier-protein] synthase I